MDIFLATLFIVVVILLIIVVLLQKGRGGGLGAAFGGLAGAQGSDPTCATAPPPIRRGAAPAVSATTRATRDRIPFRLVNQRLSFLDIFASSISVE